MVQRIRFGRASLPLLLIILIALATGCAKKPRTAEETGKIKAAVVTDTGGIGDRSFNAMAWAGVKRAGKELGVGAKFLESKEQADYATNLSHCAAQGFDVVFAVGFLMEDAIAKIAPKYPRTKFVIVDGNAPNAPIAASLKFREEEGCFLAGALAGMVSKTGKIGFVGGMEAPVISRFEAGYQAGALTVRRDARVLIAYTGRFDDPAKGKELALAQFSQGADVIFHASGSCGLGVIEAAKQKGKGFYAIGVDADQDYIAPGRVLTSMMKRVDNAVFSMCNDVVEGKFTPGDHTFGLKDGGVGLSPMAYTKQDIPAGGIEKIEALKKRIIEGEIKPPTTPAELRGFKP
jgi:basic membrane protein A